jgi:uncharacterized membrane protein
LALASVLALLALVAGRALLVYPDLPATVASHFDLHRQADGWSSKGAFLAITAAVLALVAGIGLLTPLLLARIPATWINLPHRDHWLAPERAAATRALIQTYLAWCGAATAAFAGWVLELTYRANLAGVESGAVRLSGHMWTALAVYLAFVIAWLVLFARRFRR